MPLISIIVPIYKIREDYLRKCIESLINQTYSNIEIILVNDGTPDNGGVICDEYAKNDSRIKVIHQKNLGVSMARNNGMDAATGDWITFVDADDWIDLKTCEKLKDVILHEEEIDILIFALKINYTNQEIENPFWYENFAILNKKERDELQLQILHPKSSIYSPPVAMVGVTACKLYSKVFLNKFGFYFDSKLPYSEDRLFTFQTLEYANKVIYINDFFYHYRNHSESITHRYRTTAQDENDKALIALYNCLNDFKKKKEFYHAYYYRVILSIFILSNQYFCNKSNQKPTTKKIQEIKSLFSSNLYYNAIKNIDIIQYSKVSTIAQLIGFILLKMKMYKIFYHFIKLKNNLKGLR